MSERIGIYPGTFDPIHQGHIAFAVKTLTRCRLNRVIFIPETSPRGKTEATIFSERLQSLQQSIKHIPSLEVAHIRSSPFTVENTLPELYGLFPEAELTLLIGSDIVHTFSHRWEGLEKLFATTPLAIGLRKDDTSNTIQDILSHHQRDYAVNIHYTLIKTLHTHISSSTLRGDLK